MTELLDDFRLIAQNKNEKHEHWKILTSFIKTARPILMMLSVPEHEIEAFNVTGH